MVYLLLNYNIAPNFRGKKTFVISWILFQNNYFVIRLSWSREYFVIIPAVIHSCLVWLNIHEKNFCDSI